VLNNPLSMTDPSGFFFSKLFGSIGKFFSNVFRAIGNVLKQVLKSPIFRAIVQIIGCAALPGIGCAAMSGLMSLAAGGSVGDALKAFAFAWVQMGVWDAVGGILRDASAALGGAFGVVKAGIHGIVGGALSVAQGGSFLQGFASNAIGALGGIAADGLTSDVIANTLIVAAAGCAAAAATGGKCAEGAVTAAFANLYNKFQLGKGDDARTYLNPWDVGNDAHAALQSKLAREFGYDFEVTRVGTVYFGGRVDLLDPATKGIWDIKPDNPNSISNGVVQVSGYLFAAIISGGQGYSYGGAFGGQIAINGVSGAYGTYDYRLAAPGVIAYEMATIKQNVYALSFGWYWAAFYSTRPAALIQMPTPSGGTRGGKRRR
jgi:hypothetical protein